MASLFRKRQTAATLPGDDNITDDLLASIPDVGGKGTSEVTVPFVSVELTDDDAPIALPESWSAADILARRASREQADKAEAAPPQAEPQAEPRKEKGRAKETRVETPEPPAPAPAAASPAGPDAAALVQDLRRQMETLFTREMGRVEDSFATSLRDLQARLDRASAEAEGLRRENESLLRMKAEYDRKAEALKELARSFERS